MKHLMFFILLVAFSSQLSAISSQQTLCTVPEPVEGTASGASTSSATAYPRTVDYYENQIRLADSLYKNYLPQSNFEEVKAAMEFFDSYQQSAISGQRWRLFGKEADDGNRLIAESRQLTAAKAHYYHAVGLTEKDDIVGACEHYLIALEIMEEDDVIKRLRDTKTHRRKAKINCNLNKDDYEKVRFIYLIHTRLGELYYEANFCDISLLNYKKALCYSIISRNDISIARTIKCIGHIFQLSNVADSALYYYNKSQNSSIDDINKLDVEKCIAQILFNKGEKDSAYMLLKKNLHLINDNVKYSYHCTLGNMFYIDKEYDSALYYLEESLEDSIIIKKLAFTTTLSSIYDSLGNYAKKAYYDNISTKLFRNSDNKEVDKSQLQVLYNDYKERKAEKEKIKSRTRTKVIAISLSLLIIISFVIIILIWHKSKRKDRLHQESLNEKDRYIADKEDIISKTNEEVKQKESEIKNLVEIIDGHKSDINSLKNELSIKEHEISCKETDIRKMENDLSAKEIELEKLQKNVHENSILIDRLSENHKTNEELMIAYIEEIEKLKTEIDETRNNLRDIRFRSSLIEGKINSKNTELQKKEEEINRYKLELSEYKNKLEIISSDNNDNAYTPKIGMDLYLQSKVCSKILNEINELSARNRDANILTPLKQEELVMLLNSASFYVNNFTNGIACKYSKLKKEDLYYLSLALIGLKDKQISSLLGVTYNSIRIRKKNLCSILGIKNDELQSFLMNICN